MSTATTNRSASLLAGYGDGADHPTAAVNLAALVETVASAPGCRILNSADPDAPTGRRIAAIIAERLGYNPKEVLLDADAEPALGRHPWDARPPITLDTTAATLLGYQPVGDYTATVVDEIDWLVSTAVREPDGTWSLPVTDRAFIAEAFDYSSEDKYLMAHP